VQQYLQFFLGQSPGAFLARAAKSCGEVRNSPAARLPYWVIPAATIKSSPVLESKTRETIA